MPARICVDAFNLSLTQGSGIATYGRNLLRGLRELGSETSLLYGPSARVSSNDLLNEIALVDAAETSGGRPLRHWLTTRASTLGRSARRIVPTGEVIWPSTGPDAETIWAAQDLFHRANRAFRRTRGFTPVHLGGRGAQANVDLMHWTTALPLRVPRVPNVYTIHDLVPLRLPYTTLDNKRAFLALTKRIVREADHVVVVSEATRRDVIRILGADERRVTNTYQAVSLPAGLLARSDEDVAAEVEGAFDLEWRGYFLFFGALEPKKNLTRVIQAHLASGVRAPLVIVGGREWLAENETGLMRQELAKKDSRIKRFAYLPLSALVSLIRGARATLFPSLYEGFGLPVLESMLLGTPVLTSTAGSLPEVAGDAALMVDPYDVDAIKRAIQTLDADEDLRAELSVRGRVQAEVFSPKAYRSRLAELHQKVL